MSEPKRFTLPGGPGRNPFWGALSLVMHVALVAGLVLVSGLSYITNPRTVVVLTDPSAPGRREFPIHLFAPQAPANVPTLGESEGDEGTEHILFRQVDYDNAI